MAASLAGGRRGGGAVGKKKRRAFFLGFFAGVFLATAAFFCFSACLAAPLAAQEKAESEKLLEQYLEEQMKELDFSQVEKTVEEMRQEIGEYLPNFSFRQMLKDLMHGHISWSLKDLLQGVLHYLFREVIANSTLLAQLVVLAVVCAVVGHLGAAFEAGTVGKLAQGVCYLALLTLALGSFLLTVEVGKEAIGRMLNLVQALVPVLLTLMAALGGFTSVAFLHPFIAGSLAVLSNLIGQVVFPLIFFSAALSMVNQLSDRFQVSRLARLLRQASIWLLGLIMTLFIGVLAVQGAMGAVADSVALRAARFATGAFIPIVGGAFAEALDTVLGYGLLLKNSVGFLGLMVIFLFCLFPVLKILAVVIAFKVAAVLIQPVGDERTAEALQQIAGSLGLVMVAVAAVGLMFFMTVGIILGAGTLTVMLR